MALFNVSQFYFHNFESNRFSNIALAHTYPQVPLCRRRGDSREQSSVARSPFLRGVSCCTCLQGGVAGSGHRLLRWLSVCLGGLYFDICYSFFFFFLAPTILLFLQPPQPMSFTLTLNHGKQGRSNLRGRHRQQDLLPEGLLCPRRAPSNFHLQGSRATQNRRPSICEAREKTEDAVAPIFHSRLSFTHFCSTKTFLISVAGSSPSFL